MLRGRSKLRELCVEVQDGCGRGDCIVRMVGLVSTEFGIATALLGASARMMHCCARPFPSVPATVCAGCGPVCIRGCHIHCRTLPFPYSIGKPSQVCSSKGQKRFLTMSEVTSSEGAVKVSQARRFSGSWLVISSRFV